jgi:hypothetical protein
MGESVSPVPILGRLEEVIKSVSCDEIPVCLVKGECDVSGLGELSEFTEEVRSIDSTGLGASSVNRGLFGSSWIPTGYFGLTRAIALVLSIKSNLQSSTFGLKPAETLDVTKSTVSTPNISNDVYPTQESHKSVEDHRLVEARLLGIKVLGNTKDCRERKTLR